MLKPVFQPTLRAWWAGTIMPKRLCQSAKGVAAANFTVTVLPLGQSPALKLAATPASQATPPAGFEPVTEAIELYPVVPAGWKAAPPTSVKAALPLWDCHLYMKSSAVIGVPSDQTALGLMV